MLFSTLRFALEINMKIKDDSFNMTTGNPLKNILIFAIPIMLSGLIQQGYSVADTYIVGR